MMYDKNLFLPRVHAFQSWILPPFCTKITDPEKPIEVACEQAFGRTGNYELGRGKSETPVSLPFPRYFFPQTENLFTGYYWGPSRKISNIASFESDLLKTIIALLKLINNL